MRKMHALVVASDEDCRDQLRMDRGSFQKLCYLVRTLCGLKSSRNEGSTADSRVLRDAIHQTNGLHVPRGNYYLCDNGYPNCEGFLTPYKGVRYHLSEWSSRQSQTYQEYFNMKHTRARNVIEHTFGLLKMHWGILRSPSWYPIKTTNKIIMACCLLHNFTRKEMEVDPLEGVLDEYLSTHLDDETSNDVEMIDSLETSTEWNTFRDTTAQNMFAEWNNVV
ncbi:hypothetical protein ACS0TY_003554 [Phlomoides rotata]